MSDSAGIPFRPAQERWPSAKVGEDVNEILRSAMLSTSNNG